MIVEEDYYLQHYGKKGMKWGVRNTSRTVSTPAAAGTFVRGTKQRAAKQRIRQEDYNRNKNKERAIVAAGVLAAGSIYALRLLSVHHALKVSRLR